MDEQKRYSPDERFKDFFAEIDSAAERMQIYFRRHRDCFAYLKKIGVV